MSTKLDLHTHTKGPGAGQDDGSSPAADIIAAVLLRPIDGIVVTGHHRTYTPESIKIVEGLRRAGRRAFFGAEYSSGDGHVLVFGCDVEALKLGMYAPLRVVAARALALGGIAIPSHPHADRAKKSIRGRFAAFAHDLVAIEGANGGHQRSREAFKDDAAQAEAKPLGWGLTGGSDGHHASHIGCVWTEFESTIRTEFELVRALRAKAMRPVIDDARIAELRASGASYYGSGSGASWVTKSKPKSSGKHKRGAEQLELGLASARCSSCGEIWDGLEPAAGGVICPVCYNASGGGYGDQEQDGQGQGEAFRIRRSLSDFVYRTKR